MGSRGVFSATFETIYGTKNLLEVVPMLLYCYLIGHVGMELPERVNFSAEPPAETIIAALVLSIKSFRMSPLAWCWIWWTGYAQESKCIPI